MEAILVDGFWFVLCSSRIERYIKEIIDLEKQLAYYDDNPNYWSIGSYLTLRQPQISDEEIREEFKGMGFRHLADKYGLAYIRQIYLPRLEADCRCGR